MQGRWIKTGPNSLEFIPYQYTTVNIPPPSKEVPSLHEIIQPPQGVVQQPQPQPQQQPQQQQPATAQQQAAFDVPRRASMWEALIREISKPEVAGPLQTFMAAAAAPLRPGESMGTRLAYATSLAQMHRAMLREHAQEAPLRERERLAQVQKAEALARKEAAGADVSEQTVKDEVELAKVRVRNAIKDGNLKEADLMLKELEMIAADKNVQRLDEKIDLDLQRMRADIARLQREANAPYQSKVVEDKSAAELEAARNLYNGAVKAYEAHRLAGGLEPGTTFELWIASPTSPYFSQASKVMAAKSLLESRGLLPRQQPQGILPTYRFKDGKYIRVN